MTLYEYIKKLQSLEEYSFSREEIIEKTQRPESTLRKELSRLAKRGEILNLRHGFYLVIPPRYQMLGKIPVQLYVDKLFSYLNKKYYVGLLTAASFHGASHQQIQQEYLITMAPALRDISKGQSRLRFFVTGNWPGRNIVDQKSDAGLFKISSPALTAVDCIQYHSKIGGINRILPNLEELIEEIKEGDVKDLLTWYPNKSTLQRFGFLLDCFQADRKITDLIYDHLFREDFYPVLLSPGKGQKPGRTDNRWKIEENFKLESDLS
ncbi:MAG: type IV toxin-antitoxin system AbiEi family antitoxin [Bacteroidia bacterium]|nr:type IV toxin-antitoxin system AbiEi family antitoxin [Bacteroidia bacterium]